jgi:hypothetical protein
MFLSVDKEQQVIGLARLGWTLLRIESTTVVGREAAGSYLRAAGISGPRTRTVGPLGSRTGHLFGSRSPTLNAIGANRLTGIKALCGHKAIGRRLASRNTK